MTKLELVMMIKTLSIQHGVPPDLMIAIAKTESSLRPHVINKNDNGTPSTGLFQLKLKTFKWMRCKGSIKNPRDNTICAIKYWKYQYKRYDFNVVKATIAYNVGNFSGKYWKYWKDVSKNIKGYYWT